MRHIINIIMFVMILLLAPYSYAGTYWVSSSGTASWSNCSGTTPLSGTAACSLSTANANATAGDTIYLRGGTYYIKETGITPKNSGTSTGNMITFSGYGSETAIIYGVNDVSGHSSRGINLAGKSYIKLTNIVFTNLATYLWITDGSHHNEISYCTFKDMRDTYNIDVIKTGTHTGPTGSSTALMDSQGGMAVCNNRGIFNVTDGSYYLPSDSATETTVTTRALQGGKNNYWSTGDQYKCTYITNWAGSYIYEGSTNLAVSHNWIHHNIFHHYGGYTVANDVGVALEVGVGSSVADVNCDYNTIENNHIYAAGHHVFGMNASRYSVIRNNYFHNESWYSGFGCSNMENGVCGYRVVSATVPSVAYGGHSLWEGNRIGHGAAYGGPHLTIGASGSGITLSTPANIYRNNDHVNNALYGLRLGASISTAGNNNKIYNNTFYHNGYGADDDPYASDAYRNGITLYYGSCDKISGSVIKNNLFYDHWSEQNLRTSQGYYPAIDAVSAENLTCNTITNNFNVTNFLRSSTLIGIGTDPLFVDPDLSTPLSEKPDLSLLSGSPAIDKGTYLTQANGVGSSSTTLVVGDASYFQDGTWGSDLARGSAGNFYADWIAIGRVDNIAEIQSINYSTNTITLKTPMTWAKDAPIWLYRKSDGTQVLYDSAPDMGAHEYVAEDLSVSFSPTSISFSSVFAGTLSSPQTIQLSNTGAASVTINAISLSGTNANQFTIPAATDYCTGETVAASDNCSFQVIFAPTSGGEKTASVNLNALYYGNSATLPLYGSATTRTKTIRISKLSKK